MTDFQLYAEISALPDNMKLEVSAFIESLKAKSRSKEKLKERQFGYAKGSFKILPGFDEPLDDFKDYM